MKDLQAREKVATWRRRNGFDRIAAGDNQWASRPLPLTPEQFTQSLWSELNALRDAISIAEGDRFSLRAKSFINEVGQCTINSTEAIGQFTANMTDEEFATLRRLVEKRDREAAQITVTPVDTVQYCSPRPQTPEPSPDVCVSFESNEGKMDPERDELESSSAGTGLETPGQQCPPNKGTWEKGRTIADGYFLVGMGSNQGGDNSSPTEHVGTRAGTAATPAKPRHKTTSEENKQFDPGGKGEKAPLWNAAVILSLSFLGGALDHGRLVAFASCSFVFVCLSACPVHYLLFLSGDHRSAS